MVLVAVLFCTLFSVPMWHDALGDTWNTRDLPLTLLIAICSTITIIVPVTTSLANLQALRAQRAGLSLSGARRLATIGVWAAATGALSSVGFGSAQLLWEASPVDGPVVLGVIVLSLLPCLLVLLIAARTTRGIASARRITGDERCSNPG